MNNTILHTKEKAKTEEKNMTFAFADKSDDHQSNESDAESEFSFAAGTTSTEVLAPADELFCNGQIRPFYPVSGCREFRSQEQEEGEEKETIRVPLQKLLLEERQSPVSVVESFANSAPSSPARFRKSSPARCRKSRSTGSLIKWRRISELVGRNQSEGKEKFLLLSAQEKTNLRANNAKKVGEKVVAESKKKEKANKTDRTFNGKGVKGNGGGSGSARKSYLPYRLSVVGMFANRWA